MLHKLVDKVFAVLKNVTRTDEQPSLCLEEQLVSVRQALAQKIAEDTQLRIQLEKQAWPQPEDKERSLDTAFEITRLRHKAEALEREIQNRDAGSRNPFYLEPRLRVVVLGALIILIALMYASNSSR